MDENAKLEKIIKKCVFVFIIVLMMAVIGLIILKYHVEGEQNMPFELAEMLVISTAEGHQEQESNKNNWDLEIYQTNDIYLNIKKNKNDKDTELIKSIEIKEINIEENPGVGTISMYLPDGEKQIYQYEEKNQINSEITFVGDTKSDIKNLKISNQGGTIIFRVVNKTGKKYTSNENEISHDGTLLQKVGLTSDDVKTSISFNLVIHLESDVSFVGKVSLELPTGDIATQGLTNLDKKTMGDIVFKRE